MHKTPCYVFDASVLKTRINQVRQALGGRELTFSLKANPFLIEITSGQADHIEACSPGELTICRQKAVPAEKIIYSGVVKEKEDIREAIRYGAGILTAESLRQAVLIQKTAAEENRYVRGLMRLSAGSQFGMDSSDLAEILAHREQYPNIRWLGYHYYSGTQKKKPDQIRKDLEHLGTVIDDFRERYDFIPEMTEYGPGLAADYFGPEPEKTEAALLEAAAAEINYFRYPLQIEMGRFLAASCGFYHTRVADIKKTGGTTYVLLDGGIHQLKYYGQMMAMNVPPLKQKPEREGEQETYCLCGSLCTTADILVREAKLAPLKIGDELVFERCGAYSVTEAPALFLSRDFPAIYLKNEETERCVRSGKPSWPVNIPEDERNGSEKEGG